MSRQETLEQQQQQLHWKMAMMGDGVHTQCCRRLLLFAFCFGFVIWILFNRQRCYFTNSEPSGLSSFKPNLIVSDPPSHQTSAISVSVYVQPEFVVHVTNERYASVAIDSSLIAEKFKHFDTSSLKLLTLAKGLAPSYLRVGGTAEDLLIFSSSNTSHEQLIEDQYDNTSLSKQTQNFTMTADIWEKINTFASDVGWHLVFGLNLLLRNGSRWDPANALSLMKYSDEKGYQMHLELGNEPNAFRHVFEQTVDPSQAGKDFGVLKKLMKSLTAFRSSLLIGPDVTEPVKRNKTNNFSVRSDDYLRRFLETGEKYVDVVTFHHYYVRGQTATEEDFIDPAILDSLKSQITRAQYIMNATSAKGKQLWLGEAGSASGGGALSLSDRYIAGFMWLDRLGLSAVHGVNVVIRQSFYKGKYAMIDQYTYTPFPDYWLTLLYKRLVGRRVLLTSLNNTSSYIRIYAHCTKTGDRSKYQPGAVTLYIMNLYPTDVEVTFTQFLESELHLYLLRPEGAAGLKSRVVSLNGKVLQLISDTELPDLTPKIQSGHLPVLINTLTFGFVVIPYANFTSCR